MSQKLDKKNNTFINKLIVSIIILIFIALPSILSENLFTGAVAKPAQAREEKEQGILLMEFSSDNCPACRRLEPLVKEMRNRQYPIEVLKMEDEKVRDLYDKYSIATLPTFIMLVNGQEMGRLISKGEGIQDIQPRLLRMFSDAIKLRDNKIHQSKQTAEQEDQKASLQTSLSAENKGTGSKSQEGEKSKSEANGPLVSSPADGLDSTIALSSASKTGAKYDYQYAPTTGQKGSGPMAATVRIRTYNGTSELDHGTGTIIHANNLNGNREGLVLTCGHLFRDNQGRGRLEVDLFHPETRQITTVSGECVYYDTETDIGFVGIPLPYEIKPVALISPNWQSCPGERMISVGCDGGNAPSLLNHELIANNRKFFNPKPGDANHRQFFYLQVSGAPVGGRSGGGLFVERFIGQGQYEYRLAGVCNAGDQKGNEGYFLPVSMIYETLQKQPNLQFVYNEMIQKGSSPVNPILSASAVGELSPEKAPVSNAIFEYQEPMRTSQTGNTQNIPQNSLQANFSQKSAQNNQPQISPVSNNQSVQRTAQNLEENLQTLRQYQEAGAEITCIINWPKNAPNTAPDRRSEVIHLPLAK